MTLFGVAHFSRFVLHPLMVCDVFHVISAQTFGPKCPPSIL
jgi:hypothetical protein